VAGAVPLSRQLLEHAAVDCDLGTAEGRARMLAQAKPLLELLPAGLLREQLLPEFASRGGLSADALAATWPHLSARGAPARAPSGVRRAPSWSPRRAPPTTATQLDRAAWITACHPEAWQHVAEADRDLLSDQPLPHGPYFSALDRLLHDHGPLAMPALLDELARADAGGAIGELLERVRKFHDVGFDSPDAARMELAAVLRFLHTEAVKDELTLLAEAGELSADALARQRALYAQLSQLKAGAAGT
jgi:DNA primase